MNRNDILKKCVERGVADETEVGAVSHLFYVYLLSARQRGQRVEVPNFGTFGTRIIGVKKHRKMPFFEPGRELAEKVNDRYRELKYLVIGRLEKMSSQGRAEYAGKEAPYDVLVGQVGKEILVDTHHEISVDDYEKLVASRRSTKLEEETIMPKLNLKDEGMEDEPGGFEPDQPIAPPPTLREVGGGGGGGMKLAPVLIGLLILVILGGGVYALNHFGIVHLWGKKPLRVMTDMGAARNAAPAGEAPGAELGARPNPEAGATPTPTPTPESAPIHRERPMVSIPSSGSGNFTVQVSSWASKAKADEEVTRLKEVGLDAFVQDGSVGGENWYRVRVGRYGSSKEATEAASKLQGMMEGGVWVARMPK